MPEYLSNGKYAGLEAFELDPAEKIKLSIPDERQTRKRTLSHKQINPGQNQDGNDGGRLHATKRGDPLRGKRHKV